MLTPEISPGTQYQFSDPCSFSRRNVSTCVAPHRMSPAAHPGTLPRASVQATGSGYPGRNIPRVAIAHSTRVS